MSSRLRKRFEATGCGLVLLVQLTVAACDSGGPSTHASDAGARDASQRDARQPQPPPPPSEFELPQVDRPVSSGVQLEEPDFAAPWDADAPTGRAKLNDWPEPSEFSPQ